MSLLHPPPNFPAHLTVIWPLIWVQILMLRAAMRAAYGKGVQYHWSVTPCGRVFLVSIDWVPGQKAEREWLKPSAHENSRLAAALDGSAFTPAYSLLSAHPGESRGPVPQRGVLSALDPGFRRDERQSQNLSRNLPLPET